MKACILSMQMVDNMGSLLQSFALKRILEGMNVQVEFLGITPNEEDNSLLKGISQHYTDEREKNGLLGKISKIDKYALNRLIIKAKSKRQNQLFNEFRVNCLETQKKDNKYDLCVIGSDEVFNCLNTNGWGFTSQLFGNVPEANSVITYAASCGSTRYKDLPINVAKRICETFKSVASFSTRDQNTHDFVESLIDADIEDNLDPVLIYNFDDELKGIEMPRVPEHYCLIYSYYNRIYSQEEIREITRFCRKHNLIPVAVGAPQFWIKNYILCSPFQCLKVFAGADFVFTDTFHGTIFASKYSKKFAVLVRESNRNKLCDLLNKIEIQEHQVTEIAEIEKKYYVKKNVKNFQSIIEREKKKSIQYLMKNIGD